MIDRLWYWVRGRLALAASKSEGRITPALVDLLSIRARTALAVTCLERVCEAWSLRNEELRELTRLLWQFTSAERLDSWDGQLAAAMPQDLDELEPLVAGTPLSDEQKGQLLSLLHDLSEVAGGNLFGGFHSEFTRTPLLKVVRMLDELQIPPPVLRPFTRSSVLESGGWGHPRPPAFYGRPS